MTKLQMVKVTSKLAIYGDEVYAIKTIDGYVCRQDLHNQAQAYKIAESIDAALVYEKENGSGSLDFS